MQERKLESSPESNPVNPEPPDELDRLPPATRFFARQLREVHDEFERRYGPDYTLEDTLQSPDLVLKGFVATSGFLAAIIPEQVVIHLGAFIRGMENLIEGKSHDS